MQPQGPYSPAPSPSNLPAGYEFLSPSPATKRSASGPGSTLKRVLIVAAGLIVLIILFSIVKGFLSGGSNAPQLLSVVQDQQALLHLSTGAQDQKDLSTANKNYVVTSQLSLASDQSSLALYAKKTGVKLQQKQLNMKISLRLDNQLADAATASNYNATFKQVVQTKLAIYKNDLKQAYAKTKGKNGRALLSKQYESADLLLLQINS